MAGIAAPPAPTVIGKVVVVTVIPKGAAKGAAGEPETGTLTAENLNPPAPPPPC